MAEMTAPLRRPRANRSNLMNPSAGEMEESTNRKKKAAKFDRKSVKYILDQAAIEIIVNKGFLEDESRRRENDDKLIVGALVIGIGLFAQFYPEQFPVEIPEKKRNVMCFMHYYFGILPLVRCLMARHVFMVTCPSAEPGCTFGLSLSSKISRSSNLYTLTIASAKAESPRANPPVKLTKSFTEWFSSNGVLLEDRFSKDVEGLLHDYVKESNKRGMWGSLFLIGISFCCPGQMSLLVTCLQCFLMTMCMLKLVKMVQLALMWLEPVGEAL